VFVVAPVSGPIGDGAPRTTDAPIVNFDAPEYGPVVPFAVARARQ
jgi:hypothetical protein